MIRVAAVGDVHLGEKHVGTYREHLRPLAHEADVLLLAGDLTRRGTVAQARIVAAEFAPAPVPVVAVLGNHDYEGEEPDAVAKALEDDGIRVLEGEGVVLDLPAGRLGVAGTCGFGGGFPGGTIADFGEPEMKAFAARSRRLADGLRDALLGLEADRRVALTHYAPVRATLYGEPAEIVPFLGSHLLGRAIDEGGAVLAVHGHAHAGSPDGCTPGGVPVHNVAKPVIGRPYRVFEVA